MSKLERITVTMPEAMAAQMRAAVDGGDYATTSEIVREAVRSWAASREYDDAENRAIVQLLAKARAGGRVSSNEVFSKAHKRVVGISRERLSDPLS